ncbi:MAG: hypothetical protein M3417_12915 [Actinomycetota bacterium]|nr:hypothetical protein [Actinomycetota bacterium]
MAVPPRTFTGVLGSVDALDALLGESAFGATRAAGLVVRAASPHATRIAKHVDPIWRDIGRAAWRGENALASASEAARRV